MVQSYQPGGPGSGRVLLAAVLQSPVLNFVNTWIHYLPFRLQSPAVLASLLLEWQVRGPRWAAPRCPARPGLGLGAPPARIRRVSCGAGGRHRNAQRLPRYRRWGPRAKRRSCCRRQAWAGPPPGCAAGSRWCWRCPGPRASRRPAPRCAAAERLPSWCCLARCWRACACLCTCSSCLSARSSASGARRQGAGCSPPLCTRKVRRAPGRFGGWHTQGALEAVDSCGALPLLLLLCLRLQRAGGRPGAVRLPWPCGTTSRRHPRPDYEGAAPLAGVWITPYLYTWACASISCMAAMWMAPLLD